MNSSDKSFENILEADLEHSLNKAMRLSLTEVVRVRDKIVTLLPKALVCVPSLEIPTQKLHAFDSLILEDVDKHVFIGSRYWKYRIMTPENLEFDTYVPEILYDRGDVGLLNKLPLNVVEHVGIPLSQNI